MENYRQPAQVDCGQDVEVSDDNENWKTQTLLAIYADCVIVVIDGLVTPFKFCRVKTS
jgi:hypothetical protein